MVSSVLFTNSRIDLTENELFTLTDGTRNIISKIEEPVTMYLFYSDKASEDVPQLRIYATRVKELLKELKKIKITQIEKNDPFLSELSKKQKIILEAFDAKEDLLHSY